MRKASPSRRHIQCRMSCATATGQAAQMFKVKTRPHKTLHVFTIQNCQSLEATETLFGRWWANWPSRRGNTMQQ